MAAEAGVCGPSVTKALKEMEAIGLVTVILDPGPRTNTYRLQWENLKVPQEQARPQGKKARSPFVMPKMHKVPEVPLAEEEHGPGKLPWSKMPSRSLARCRRRGPRRVATETRGTGPEVASR